MTTWHLFFSPSHPSGVLFWRRVQEVAPRPACCARRRLRSGSDPRSSPLQSHGPAPSAVSALGLHGRSSLLSGYRSLPPLFFFSSFFLLLLVSFFCFFWDYIFFWWFFNSNSMHRKWVNCTRNMVSFVFYIPERNHSSSSPAAAAAAILSSNTVHCLLTFFSFLSLKPQFVNRGRAQKVSALLFLIVYIYVIIKSLNIWGEVSLWTVTRSDCLKMENMSVAWGRVVCSCCL